VVWMNEHKRVWRGGVLVLLLAAIRGPWTFDVIYVPSKYVCSAPFIRLEGNFCGIPLSGIKLLSTMAGGLTNIAGELVAGTTMFSDRFGELLFCLLGLVLILPVFSTLFLILREDSRGWFVFHIAALSLAFGTSLLFATFNYPKLFWELWGMWLYVGVTASALILEVVMLAARRRLKLKSDGIDEKYQRAERNSQNDHTALRGKRSNLDFR
jgi:hypothetical protein